ncbi:MAG: hypothetical protein KatS3mg047_1069 [Bellilinea sp.]|nr:MAG: hypothetical protein KatS3mg047_1069 [Bellilinea sp.]
MAKLHLTPQKHHLENAKLARQGKKPVPAQKRQFKVPKFELYQDETGEWMLRFEKSNNTFPATDVEVALWLKLKRLEENK